MKLRLNIPMTPVPKGRPRMARNGAVYTPRETREAESYIESMVRRAWTGEPIQGPISVELIFWMPRPKTVRRGCHIVKPDLDNLAKLVLDAAQPHIFRDDCQIVHLSLAKHYTQGAGKPGIDMIVESL